MNEHNRLAIEQLIRQLADTDRVGTALGEAARWGRLDILKEFLATGLHVDTLTEARSTPLMLASSGGQINIVKYLLKHGADANTIGGTNGMTPLIACLAGRHTTRVYLTICKLLLDAGATTTLSHRDQTGRTALDWANDGRPSEVGALISQHVSVSI